MSDPREILDTGMTLDDLRESYPLERPDETDPRSLITSSFEIMGEHLDPRECSEVIGIEPTMFSAEPRTRGTWLPSGRPNVVYPFWRLELRKVPGDDINEGLISLLARLWPRREQVLLVTRRPGISAGFSTTVTIFDDRPVYRLAPETLRRLGFFELEWGLDVIDLRE